MSHDYARMTFAGLMHHLNEVLNKGDDDTRRQYELLLAGFFGAFGALLRRRPGLMPPNEGDAMVLAERWLRRVVEAIGDARFSMATALVWPNVVQCSEGNFSSDICPGTDDERRMFVCAARSIRLWLSDGDDQATEYLNGPRRLAS